MDINANFIEYSHEFLTKDERDMLFVCLNQILHTKMNRLGTADQYCLIGLYDKLRRIYPSGFHTSKQLEDFLEG